MEDPTRWLDHLCVVLRFGCFWKRWATHKSSCSELSKHSCQIFPGLTLSLHTSKMIHCIYWSLKWLVLKGVPLKHIINSWDIFSNYFKWEHPFISFPITCYLLSPVTMVVGVLESPSCHTRQSSGHVEAKNHWHCVGYLHISREIPPRLHVWIKPTIFLLLGR